MNLERSTYKSSHNKSHNYLISIKDVDPKSKKYVMFGNAEHVLLDEPEEMHAKISLHVPSTTVT